MDSLEEGRDAKTVDVQLLAVLIKNANNYTLGRAFFGDLGITSFTVHLKMEYHNIYDKLLIFYVDLARAH